MAATGPRPGGWCRRRRYAGIPVARAHQPEDARGDGDPGRRAPFGGSAQGGDVRGRRGTPGRCGRRAGSASCAARGRAGPGRAGWTRCPGSAPRPREPSHRSTSASMTRPGLGERGEGQRPEVEAAGRGGRRSCPRWAAAGSARWPIVPVCRAAAWSGSTPENDGVGAGVLRGRGPHPGRADVTPAFPAGGRGAAEGCGARPRCRTSTAPTSTWSPHRPGGLARPRPGAAPRARRQRVRAALRDRRRRRVRHGRRPRRRRGQPARRDSTAPTPGAAAPDGAQRDAASLLPDQVRPGSAWTIRLDAEVCVDVRVERARVRSRAALSYVEARSG